nr:hypothetical protein [Tanacetum cinerariifolium]
MLAYDPKHKIPPPVKKEQPAKDTECHHCHKTGHWKMNCPLYLVELKKKASTSGTSVLGVNLILTSLSKDYDQFVQNYNMHGMGKTILELHTMLKHVEKGEHSKSLNYQAALSNLESKKWLDAMNVEMQSIKDNQVWNLVDLPPNYKTVRSKWLFNKKTNMDGNIHTYKAHLVVKGEVAYILGIKICRDRSRGAIDWKSSKQSTTAMSSMKAEYIAAVEAAMEVI